MPSISKTPSTIRTADDQPIEDGMILYHWNNISPHIITFKVAYWNDGKTANLYFNYRIPELREAEPHYVDLTKHHGGEIIPGVYPCDEDNAYCGLPISGCYANLENCKDAIRKHYADLLSKLLDSPPQERTQVFA